MHEQFTVSRPRQRLRPIAEMNVTSLVDVVLVLLIIFMLTAPFIQGGIDVDLPQAKTPAVLVRILVVSMQPGHAEWQVLLVATLGGEVEHVIGAVQHVQAPREGLVGQEDPAVR